MVAQMGQVSQPSLFGSWVRSFGSFDAAHGWAVNFVVVVALIGIGACFVSGRPRLLRIGVIAGGVLCLATWVLVQDFGFFGGVGTDPNSMIPMALVFIAGYVAVVRVPVRAESPAPARPATAAPAPTGFFDRLSPSYLLRSLAAIGAVGVVLVGAAPMALASANPTADPIVTEATNGTPNVVDAPAAPFALTDQAGRKVSLRSLAGHTVVLTFLDPVCTSDCPLIAQELRVTDRMLGAGAAGVDFVAVVANPLYTSTAVMVAFDKQEGLDHVPNWTYLTGSDQPAPQGLERLRGPGGRHPGRFDDRPQRHRLRHRRHRPHPGDPRRRSGRRGTPASRSSFSALLTGQVQRIDHS